SALRCYKCSDYTGRCENVQECTYEDACISLSEHGGKTVRQCLRYTDCDNSRLSQMFPALSGFTYRCCSSNIPRPRSSRQNQLFILTPGAPSDADKEETVKRRCTGRGEGGGGEEEKRRRARRGGSRVSLPASRQTDSAQSSELLFVNKSTKTLSPPPPPQSHIWNNPRGPSSDSTSSSHGAFDILLMISAESKEELPDFSSNQESRARFPSKLATGGPLTARVSRSFICSRPSLERLLGYIFCREPLPLSQQAVDVALGLCFGLAFTADRWNGLQMFEYEKDLLVPVSVEVLGGLRPGGEVQHPAGFGQRTAQGVQSLRQDALASLADLLPNGLKLGLCNTQVFKGNAVETFTETIFKLLEIFPRTVYEPADLHDGLLYSVEVEEGEGDGCSIGLLSLAADLLQVTHYLQVVLDERVEDVRFPDDPTHGSDISQELRLLRQRGRRQAERRHHARGVAVESKELLQVALQLLQAGQLLTTDDIQHLQMRPVDHDGKGEEPRENLLERNEQTASQACRHGGTIHPHADHQQILKPKAQDTKRPHSTLAWLSFCSERNSVVGEPAFVVNWT
ncbi:hypothetical protein CRUP_027393, partial [Coryphaenoides rupestris]